MQVVTLPGENPKAAMKVGRKIPTEETAKVLPTLSIAKKYVFGSRNVFQICETSILASSVLYAVMCQRSLLNGKHYGWTYIVLCLWQE